MNTSIKAFIPCSNEVVAFGLAMTEKKNQFGENVGQIVAIDQKGLVAPIKFRKLLENLGISLSNATNSIHEKASFLEALKRNGYRPKIEVMLRDTTFKQPHTTISHIYQFKKNVIKTNTKYINLEQNIKVFSSRFILRAEDPKSQQTMKIVHALYDKINKLLTYTPAGGTPLIDKKDGYLQIIPNGMPINLESYKNNPPISPMYPGGDFRTTEEFARIASANFGPNGKLSIQSIDNAYRTIINGANSSQQPDKQSEEILKKALSYLYVERVEKNPFTGKETVIKETSPNYTAYTQARTRRTSAYIDYLNTKNRYNLSKLEDQRKWQVLSLQLQLAIDIAEDEVKKYKFVRQALDILEAYGNDAVTYVINDSKNIYTKSEQTGQIDKIPFHISYGFPSNWYEDDSGYSQFSFTSKEASGEDTTKDTQYGGGGSFQYGLFSTEGSFRKEDREERSHIETSEFRFDFKIGTIPILRPWMNTVLFALKNWNLGGQPAGIISGGIFPAADKDSISKILPYYSTAFVIAKDIKISGKWSESDSKKIETALKTNLSVGIGPFSIKGSYSNSSSKDTFTATDNNGEFSIPGAQIIGVTNTVVPFAAPDKG
ncbi:MULTISPECIES: hypothetical protein [unclassified Neochlamydia]|uniref:hypothetical protein n=1 Tax=unclassified Neochlamydia TaxID=2643326 RepID=UPI00140C24D9|nr:MULTISPECIES: hypothetical protein [unclassified Neochlamydia]